jgi:integrase
MATMRERDPGVWELRVYVGRDQNTGRPRQVSKTFRGGKRAANAALAQLVVDHQEGKLGGSGGTVTQLLDEWLRTGTPEISPVTRATYARTVELLRPVLGSKPLARLSPHDIDVAYQSMVEAGVSPYVLRQVHVSLRSALSTGMRWGWTRSNPAKLVATPKVPNRQPTAPSRVAGAGLIRALEVDHPDVAGFVTLAALTGLRRGELCGLRWKDIDDGALQIRRAIVVAGGKPIESLPKMGKTASVLIPGPVAWGLLRIRQAQAERAQTSNTTPPPDGWIFSSDGMGFNPYSPDWVGRLIVKYGKKAGTPVRPHELRHFAATVLLSSGVDIRTAASQLRHDPRVLLDHYAALDPARRREAADVLGRALIPPE